MRKPFFSQTLITGFAAGSLLLLPAAPTARAAAADGGVERLKTLNAQIDSLEVEKQAKKRSGQELSDLEEQTALLRDSIQALRSSLEKRTAAAPQSPEQAAVKSFLPGTLGLFDWILIMGAGLVVVLALLFILVYRLGASRRAQTARQVQPSPKKWEPQETAGKPRDTAIQRAYASQMKNGAPAKPADMESADARPRPQPAAPPRPAAPPATPASDLPKNQTDLVIRAAASGLDIKEISRRYHIGEDQVSLILKMSKKQ